MKFGTTGLAVYFTLLASVISSTPAQAEGKWLSIPQPGRSAYLMYSAPISRDAKGNSSGPVPLTITCNDSETDVSISGFTPSHTYPQPDLVIHFGSIPITSRPNLLVDGTSGLADLRVFFHITDSVLNAIEAGSEIRMKFDTQEQVFPSPPITIREAFVQKCRSLVIPEMRKG